MSELRNIGGLGGRRKNVFWLDRATSRREAVRKSR